MVDNHSVSAPVDKGVPVSQYQEATRTCEICPLAKSTMRPHHHAPAGSPHKRTDKPYSHMHMDIKTMGNKSYGGNQYLLNLVDDATNALHTFPLKQKSELPRSVAAFHRRQVKPLGLKINDLTLDRAGEQRSREFEEFCATDNILPHYTTTADSRANAKIERANRTISTDILANRIQAGLSRKAWAELGRAPQLFSQTYCQQLQTQETNRHFK